MALSAAVSHHDPGLGDAENTSERRCGRWMAEYEDGKLYSVVLWKREGMRSPMLGAYPVIELYCLTQKGP